MDKQCYAPVFVSNEKMWFMINFDKLHLNTAPALLTLSLVDSKFNMVVNNIADLQYKQVATNFYTFYATIEADPPEGYYYLILHSGDSVTYCTNHMIEYRKEPRGALKCVWRSTGNIYNYFYKDLPDYFNTLYLDIIPHKPEFTEFSQGHNNILERYTRTRHILKEYTSFAAQWFDRGAQAAFVAMTSHNTLVIEGVRYGKDDNSTVEIDWVEGGGYGYGYDLACSEITLLNLDALKENTDC